jgi:catechol 2,3-dioxygenase-like lactoylglutathione lyase family enzyme
MIRVFDEARSVDFYRRALGLEVIDRLAFVACSSNPSRIVSSESDSDVVSDNSDSESE